MDAQLIILGIIPEDDAPMKPSPSVVALYHTDPVGGPARNAVCRSDAAELFLWLREYTPATTFQELSRLFGRAEREGRH